MEEIEIVGLQLPRHEQAALVLKRPDGGGVFVVGLSGHQLESLQAAMCRCRATQTPAALAVATALGQPVAAVALSLPAGRPPVAWMLLNAAGTAPGRLSRPLAAMLPVRVDIVDALEAVVRAGCRLVLAPDGDVGALCRSWPAAAAPAPVSTDQATPCGGAADGFPGGPAGEMLEVPAAFRAALEMPDRCDGDRKPDQA